MLRFFGFYGVNWQFDRGGVPQIFDADEWQEPVIVAFCAEDDDGILDVGASDDARFDFAFGVDAVEDGLLPCWDDGLPDGGEVDVGFGVFWDGA